MSWDEILIIALACSAGMIAGVVLGWLVSPLAGALGAKAKKSVGGIMVIAGAVAGYAFLPPVISPFVEPRLEQFAGEASAATAAPASVQPEIAEEVVAAAIDEALAGLNDPFFDAVLEREPNRSSQIRTRLASAYRRGGEEALMAALMAADREILQVSFPYYMARAQEGDLIAAVQQIRVVIAMLSENDPMTCHTWLYGGMLGARFDFDRYIAAIGPSTHLEMQTRLGAVVRGASEILPDYDETHAVIVLDEVRVVLNDQLGDEKVGLIMATQQPGNDNDARLACEASGDYYDLILQDTKAVDVLRHRYSGGNEFL
ncbi:hypothetical protein [Aquisalinus flavus]|uniref:Uncharacterized protein n=1 Tax=Aquisalinus flavus TaxID=1526572 RepID=A0A8J2V701_9PROT|nr:hypothetical protein [Aquisalinus flavus]MBD0427195.1 hypothetical protein [Aquisalinus flavus]UNE47010.1 hypothetical protein FF099_02535 [Aquisalinus flavus]GGC99093.1 hypothetical protein GCM10011342_05090 [Aquisalinus flavus]